LPEPKLADSPVENYDAYAKGHDSRPARWSRQSASPDGSTLVIIQKTYGGKVLEAILYIKPRWQGHGFASYGKSKAIK